MGTISLFDTGPCTVDVSKSGVSYFSGVLGKGGSSAPFAGAAGSESEMCQVTVDGAGVVTMLNLNGSTDLTDNYLLRVTPSASLSGLTVQAAEMSCWRVSVSQLTPVASCDNTDSIALTYGSGTLPADVILTPDPATFTGITDAQWVAVNMGAAI